MPRKPSLAARLEAAEKEIINLQTQLQFSTDAHTVSAGVNNQLLTDLTRTQRDLGVSRERVGRLVDQVESTEAVLDLVLALVSIETANGDLLKNLAHAAEEMGYSLEEFVNLREIIVNAIPRAAESAIALAVKATGSNALEQFVQEIADVLGDESLPVNDRLEALIERLKSLQED